MGQGEGAQAQGSGEVIARFSTEAVRDTFTMDESEPIGTMTTGRAFDGVEIRATVPEFIDPRFMAWVCESILLRAQGEITIRIVL